MDNALNTMQEIDETEIAQSVKCNIENIAEHIPIRKRLNNCIAKYKKHIL